MRTGADEQRLVASISAPAYPVQWLKLVTSTAPTATSDAFMYVAVVPLIMVLRRIPRPMAIIVIAPFAAIGPRTGNPSQTHSIIVLESERSECRPKNRPARPRAAMNGDLLCTLGVLSTPPLSEVRVEERRAARTAMNNPSLFQPPFSACIIGHTGLLV